MKGSETSPVQKRAIEIIRESIHDLALDLTGYKILTEYCYFTCEGRISI
jgi:hypothetical protein